MKKKTFILPLISFLLLSCGQSLVKASSTSFSSHTPFVYGELEEGEASIAFHEGRAILWWEAPEYEGYRVYSSETKYGSYALLSGDSLLQSQNYSAKKNRYGYFKVMGIRNGKEEQIGKTLSIFGDSTLLIGQDDNMSLVQREIEERHSRLESFDEGQFSSERFAAMFLKGEYQDISMKLGYYTSAYGLGETPEETSVGEIYVSTNILSDNNATCTFWRNVENLSTKSDTQFAVSQATSLRRCHFEGSLALAHPSGWSSGGFLADSKIDKTVSPRTQQQWISRNDEIHRWSGSGHNYVFVGCVGGLPEDSWSESTSRTTIIEKTPKVAEMPFTKTAMTFPSLFPM